MRFLLSLFLLCLLGCHTPKDGWPNNLSEADKHSVVEFIKTLTDEPIRIIRYDDEAPELLKVLTGHELKAFTSSGNVFFLKKTQTGWQVVHRGTWDS